MFLQNLLGDNRTEWQKRTQEEILNSLLCKAHKYKSLGQKEDRLVMVFGKSHAGKTTFILTLLGVDEKKLDEVNLILRAGVPEGSSSTSTAIIYQKSDDDMFGICERAINDVMEAAIIKCSQEQFIQKISSIRNEVESGERKNDNIIFLYLPKGYFTDKIWKDGNITILDVPGYETRNEKERYHTDAILNKYMSISVLNIVVISINDINDLRYFVAPNRDDASKLISGKYIIVTTRSYSEENVFKFFLKNKDEREGSFEELLEGECQRQFERIFGKKIPKVFPIDIGQSFQMLIESKIENQEDKEYIVNYRNGVLKSIYECIFEKQANSLISWIQEVVEDEDYYGNNEVKAIEGEIEVVQKKISKVNTQLDKGNHNLEKLRVKMEELTFKILHLQSVRNDCISPNYDEIIDEKIQEYIGVYFTKRYEWKVSTAEKSVSAHLAKIYVDILDEMWNVIGEQENILDVKEKEAFAKIKEEGEYSVREELEKITNKHSILKVLNPSNKEKVELGSKLLHEKIPKIGASFFDYYYKKIDKMINEIEIPEQNKLAILIKENDIKRKHYLADIEILHSKLSELEEKKITVEKRVEKDKSILAEYRKIAEKYYYEQRNKIIDCINNASSGEERLNYVLFLGILASDYKKIMME